MKSLTTLIVLTFSVMFSSSSYAKWTEVSETEDGDTFYVDFERIKKHDGYFYYWILRDYLVPGEYSRDLSSKVYRQGDCKLFRYKDLSFSYHQEPMGGGTGEVDNKPDKKWNYPPPNTSIETVLKQVCNR